MRKRVLFIRLQLYSWLLAHGAVRGWQVNVVCFCTSVRCRGNQSNPAGVLVLSSTTDVLAEGLRAFMFAQWWWRYVEEGSLCLLSGVCLVFERERQCARMKEARLFTTSKLTGNKMSVLLYPRFYVRTREDSTIPMIAT